MQVIVLNDGAVDLVEALSGLGRVQKTRVGRIWEVPVDERTYRLLADSRRPDENWSETVMRLVNESHRLRDIKA